MIGISDIVLREKLNLRRIDVVAMEIFERWQCALAVDRRLLALLGRLRSDDDRKGFLARDVEIKIRARTPRRQLLHSKYFGVVETSDAAKSQYQLHMVVRRAILTGTGDKTLLLCQVLKNEPAALGGALA